MKYTRDRVPIIKGRTLSRLPSGRLQVLITLGTRDGAPNPAVLTCDSCLGAGSHLWFYRHRGFGLYPHRPSTEFAAGAWALCVHCRALYRSCETALLIARVVTLNPQLDPAAATAISYLLPDVFVGDAVEWESGQRIPLTAWSEERLG